MEREFEWHDNGFIVTLSGELHIHDISDTDDIWKSSPNVGRMEYQIWDMLECDFSNIYESDVGRVVAQDSFTSQFILPDMKLALVTTDERTISVCDAYIRRSEDNNSNWDIRIFPTVEAAEEWCYSSGQRQGQRQEQKQLQTVRM